MSYQTMTPFRVSADGKNLPTAWVKKQTLTEAGYGDWIVFPQEAGSAEITLDASAGCGFVQYTNDVEAVLSGETPAGITIWERGEVRGEVASDFLFAGGAFRLVNRVGTITMVAIAKQGGAGEQSFDMGAVAATGSIVISEQNAEDGDTVTIDDGEHEPKVFEFDDDTNVGSGNIRVEIGDDHFESIANLVTAINDTEDLNVVATDNGNGSCALTNEVPGEDGNVALSKSGDAITVSGMSGGKDAITFRDLYDAVKNISIDADTINVDLDALGKTTDEPLSGDTAEGATGRSGISLWKRVVNKLIELKTALTTSSAGAYIRQDSNATIAKETGGNLAAAANSLAAFLHRYRVTGDDTYWATGTYASSTSFTFTPDPRVTSVTDDAVIMIVQRSSSGAWTLVPLDTVHITGSSAPYTCTVTGSTFASGDLIRICMRGAVRSHTDATNSNRVDLITRQDNLATALTAIALNATVTKNTEVYWPAGGTTLNSCWDAFSINGGGGLGGYFAFTVGATTAAGSTPKIYVYATDDHNTTIASKRWGKDAFVRNGSTVTEIELAENSTQVVLFHVPIFHRYYAISMHEHDNVADVTGVYIDASVIPA